MRSKIYYDFFFLSLRLGITLQFENSKKYIKQDENVYQSE